LRQAPWLVRVMSWWECAFIFVAFKVLLDQNRARQCILSILSLKSPLFITHLSRHFQLS
jgi:hypothetical protein